MNPRAMKDPDRLRLMYRTALYLTGPAADILVPVLAALIPARDRKEIMQQIRKTEPNHYFKRYRRALKRLGMED